MPEGPLTRTPLSKRQRFAVFKRDSFRCQYCGRTPPDVVLEVDHVQPVARGGSSDVENLLTACFDCNRGKGAEPLSVAPLSVTNRTEILKEKQAQLKAYNGLLAKISAAKQADIQGVVDVYDDAFDGWTLDDSARASISQFLNHLPKQIVIDAMLLAVQRMSEEQQSAFRYFCGVCWRIIKGDGRNAR